MSLARAMTKRMRRTDASQAAPTRSASARNPGQHIDRKKISMPVALISTTNMLSYNAPDIATMRHASNGSTSTNLSGDDSDHTTSTTRSRSSSNHSRETLTDASSVGSSPTSPEPNHLSCYFPPANATRESISSSKVIRKTESMDSMPAVAATLSSPAIPQRALSHSKRAHERIANKRSLQNMKPPSSIHTRDSTRSSCEQRTSLDMFKNTPDEHPFGKELEQLNEVAEEFGGVVRDAEMEEDMAVIAKLGLAKFRATDYFSEIQPLFNSLFETRYLAAPTAWI
ncbi:uncharacterized protein BDZ99DRAFT_86095 [Mytilinidion resinicola]|uniref:Uncharacterized protein n=1 Tax=Mytilinidion resinicola TaxID=574789 RepID=A0A6A6YDC2_9PEZI|nr:uncharacterized protein BDZ99DRAFT_86095 [Mytilinidion resinicola]KAF2806822.1 hypothetical protein BDZ99DRAFT_86095 [Mytilinidion resinicola]